MNKHSASAWHNMPTGVTFTETEVCISVKDGRRISIPLAWFPFLENATPEERENYTLSSFSVNWWDLDDGIDMAMVAGNHTRDIVTPEQMAKMHGVAPNTIYRILRSEIDTDEDQKRIKGAFFDGEGRRRQWYIPRKAAEEFKTRRKVK